MALADVKRINELFQPFYPYLAEQILNIYGRSSGLGLELGPYSLGISAEIVRRHPRFNFVIGDEDPKVLEYFNSRIKELGYEERIVLKHVKLHSLAFPPEEFDLVIFRGGLFFWTDTPQILREIRRVLKPQGLGAVGGGFGKAAPAVLIQSRLEESKRLNRRLGKRVLTRDEILSTINAAHLEANVTLEDQHGLWVYINKP